MPTVHWRLGHGGRKYPACTVSRDHTDILRIVLRPRLTGPLAAVMNSALDRDEVTFQNPPCFDPSPSHGILPILRPRTARSRTE